MVVLKVTLDLPDHIVVGEKLIQCDEEDDGVLWYRYYDDTNMNNDIELTVFDVGNGNVGVRLTVGDDVISMVEAIADEDSVTTAMCSLVKKYENTKIHTQNRRPKAKGKVPTKKGTNKPSVKKKAPARKPSSQTKKAPTRRK